MKELVVLAVARMQSGVCIAGVPPAAAEETPRWIRPVKPFGALLPGDLHYADGSLMRPWDVAALALVRKRSRPPHTEDVEADFVRTRPQRRGRVEDPRRRELLERLVDADPHAVWATKERSITLIRPATVAATFSLDPYSERYEARLWWPGCGRPDGLPVTDLKWRALGRRLAAEGYSGRRLEEVDLRRLLGCEAIYLVLGLSRTFKGEYWPLVAAVHTLPEYEAEVDEGKL